MALQINNNAPAFDVFASYSSNLHGLKQSMGRLSTGTKMVADDPSGVGISERMRSQAKSTAMARQNVENGVSILQTADSWLQKIHDVLGRMHELAVEANDGTKTTTDQANVQAEFAQLQDEITRITSRSTAAAKFNGLYLFRGGDGNAAASGDTVSSGTVDLQVGADQGQALNLSLADLQVGNSAAIGTVHTYTYSNNVLTGSAHNTVQWASVIDRTKLSVGASDTIGRVQIAIDFVSAQRAQLGAQQSRLEHTRSGLLAYEDDLRAAESQIRDIDVAKESTELAKYQILTQVGNTMLAQANQLPAAAVQLLG